MNILAIDTSTEACSAALLRDDGEIFSEFEIAPRQHTRLLPIMINAVLAASRLSKQSLTHCAFANGPGAFTGVRIAAATIQGIAIGLGIPVIQISTLATLAQNALDKHAASNVLVALDARMSEVYWAWYQQDEQGLARLHGVELLSKLEDVKIDSMPACGAGHGWKIGSEMWNAKFNGCSSLLVDAELLPDARSLIKLARKAVSEDRVVSPENTSINYLRNQVAKKSRR